MTVDVNKYRKSNFIEWISFKKFQIQFLFKITMTVGITFPRKILNNGKEPCEPLPT